MNDKGGEERGGKTPPLTSWEKGDANTREISFDRLQDCIVTYAQIRER